MPSSDATAVLVTGLGITSAIGHGAADFTAALLAGKRNFAIMKRPGRQCSSSDEHLATSFIGAEIPSFVPPSAIPSSILRTASLSGQVALATVHEAWHDARLQEVDPVRIGLVVGGSNVQQRELVRTHESYRDRPQFLRPSYGMSFMDSDISGMCSEVFGIKGFAYTLGGASASGQLAAIHAVQAVTSGQVDVCIAVGALMDLSHWECQALRSLGAMGSDEFASEPRLACRPFDRRTDGFIFGESCGVLVVERAETASRCGVNAYARVAGWAIGMDANRNPNPSFEGEAGVLRQALQRAGFDAQSIDYVNPHGTGSKLGDATELKAIEEVGLKHAYINTTKSLIGHGLSAAGASELVATLLQMRASRLHPCANLEQPIDEMCNWVAQRSVEHDMRRAVKISLGFSGINCAMCLERI